MELIFVYGTLKLNGPNHYLLRGEQNLFIADARTTDAKWDLVSFEKFPALINGDCFVSGELYKIDRITDERIKRLENGLYIKIILPVVSMSATRIPYLASTYLWRSAVPESATTDYVMYDPETNIKHWSNDSYFFE